MTTRRRCVASRAPRRRAARGLRAGQPCPQRVRLLPQSPSAPRAAPVCKPPRRPKLRAARCAALTGVATRPEPAEEEASRLLPPAAAAAAEEDAGGEADADDAVVVNLGQGGTGTHSVWSTLAAVGPGMHLEARALLAPYQPHQNESGAGQSELPRRDGASKCSCESISKQDTTTCARRQAMTIRRMF